MKIILFHFPSLVVILEENWDNKNNPEKIKSRTIIIYLVKYVFFGIILYVSHTDPDWNVYLTFVGLLTFRIVTYPVAIISANKGDDENA